MNFELPSLDYVRKKLYDELVPEFLLIVQKNAAVTLKIIARDGKITGTKIEIDNPFPPE